MFSFSLHTKANRLMFCQSGSLVNTNGPDAVAHVLRCRCWRCDQCRPMRRRAVIATIAAGDPSRFLTLTLAYKPGADVDDLARRLVRAWTELARRIRRNWPGRELEYFRVMEAHKSGAPHMHLAVRSGWLDYDWLKENWLAITGSWNVDIRRIWPGSQRASYISKYLGQDLHAYQGVKRYFASRGWIGPDERKPSRAGLPNGEWYRCRLSLDDWATVQAFAGFTVTRDGDTARARKLAYCRASFGAYGTGLPP
jgi:hypothetical protein